MNLNFNNPYEIPNTLSYGATATSTNTQVINWLNNYANYFIISAFAALGAAVTTMITKFFSSASRRVMNLLLEKDPAAAPFVEEVNDEVKASLEATEAAAEQQASIISADAETKGIDASAEELTNALIGFDFEKREY